MATELKARELVKPQAKSNQLRAVLTNRETFATTLLTLVVDTYGTEAFEWSPQTLHMELHDDFQVDVPQANIDKIMAGIAIMTSDDFYTRLPVFNHICNVLSGDPFDPSTFEPATPEEMAWAVVEASLLYPPDEGQRFSPDICGYIAYMLDLFGVSKPPAILAFAVPDDKPDPLNNVADDPELYQAFYENQQMHASEIDKLIKEELQDLIQQLSSLPLKHGSTDELVSRLRGTFSPA